MTIALELLDEIIEGAQAIGIAPTTLCQKAVRNGALIGRLEKGGGVNSRTIEQIRAFIAANRPPSAPADAANEPERTPS
jgi:hypothetical protein